MNIQTARHPHSKRAGHSHPKEQASFNFMAAVTIGSDFGAQENKVCQCFLSGASLIAHLVNHLPAMQETRVRSLGQEDPLEKEMATHSSTLAWKIPWTEEPGRLQSMGLQRVGHN